jgi:hypothetical protein
MLLPCKLDSTNSPPPFHVSRHPLIDANDRDPSICHLISPLAPVLLLMVCTGTLSYQPDDAII